MGLICHQIPAHGGSGTSKYYCEKCERSLVYFKLKETSFEARCIIYYWPPFSREYESADCNA